MGLLAPLKTGMPLVIALTGVASLVVMVACGTGSDGATDSVEDGPLVVRDGDTFDVDSFVNGGWKKSKEFSTETVPESNAIWYGFYKGEDVEVRFYGSHADALGPGLESANAAVDRVSNANLQGNAIFASGQRTQYNDFMVAGNTVILCQSNIEVCAELVENIP
ncbi:MAG: hypothetical protein QF357_01240 [Dehalococcoidia bacterium]|jgi:hypothetical protein|nr:hypothetical protein [Dehalococcoidia bacterium]